MDLKFKSIVITATCIIFVFLAIKLSDAIPFYGDEFYTLDIENVPKPILYKIIISWYIENIQVGPDSIFILRFSSVIFSLLGISLILWYIPKDKRELYLLSLILISNSFILKDAVLFRYYSFYFLSSVLFLIYILKWSKHLSTNTKLLLNIGGIFISPYLFFVLTTLQFIFAFIFIILFQKIKVYKYRLIFGSTLILGFILSLISPQILWYLFDTLKISRHMEIDINSIIIRGVSISTMVKPIYALFQMIFGYHVTPSGSFIIITLFTIIGLGYCYIGYLFLKKEGIDSFLILLFTFCIPFFLIYCFFEPLSFPGFTQFESKHGLLLMPLMIFLGVKSIKLMPSKIYIPFLILLLSGQLFGIKKSYQATYTDWNLVTDKVNNYLKYENSQKILIDGRSMETFNFYNQNIEIIKMISYTWEPIDSLEFWIKDKERLVLLLNDYKSYTPLTVEQNWNAGSGSWDRVEKLNMLLKIVNKDYYLDDSYISYPTFLYLFKKKIDRTDNILSAGVWQHHLKDLVLPIKSNEKNDILSSIIIQPGDSAEVISDSILVFNLEKSENIKYGDLVGSIIINGNAINLIKGENIWDVFAEFHDANINDNKVFHSWYHKPLVSGSIRYNGSYYKHKAHIYSLGLGKKLDNKIKVINTSVISSIRIWN